MKHQILDIETAAALAGVSRQSVYAAIARKALPRRYSQGTLVVREADLIEWRAAKTKRGRPKGRKQSNESKAKIAEAQKKRWATRKSSPARGT